MTDEERDTWRQTPAPTRRAFLQSTAGAGVATAVGVGSLGTAQASGEEEWAFEIGGEVYSSPTVVDGTVFVGSRGDNLYAVDAASGEEEWAFETGSYVYLSPTVVDGTVFVGSWDGNLYAVDAGVSGSSEGTRAMLGTLGHHGQASSAPDADDDGPGFGVGGALTSIGSVAYLLKRRRDTTKSESE